MIAVDKWNLQQVLLLGVLSAENPKKACGATLPPDLYCAATLAFADTAHRVRRIGDDPSTNHPDRMMTERFARNTAYSTAAGLIMSLGRFATTVAMARVLGVEATGVAAFALWLISLTCAITSLGVYPTLTRYLPELKSANDAASLARLLLVPYGGVACLAAVLFVASYEADLFGLAARSPIVLGQASIALVIALYLVQSLATFGLGYLVGQQRFRRFAVISAISNILQLLIVVVGGLAWGVNGALLGYLAGWLPLALVCAGLLGGKPRAPEQVRSRLFRFSMFSWASTLANELVWARLEMAFLGHFWGSGAVGLYSVGFTLASLATQGPLLLTGGLLPYFAEAIGSNRHERARARLQTAMRLVAFFVLPMCFGISTMIPKLLPMLYGESFSGGVVPAMVLVSSAGIGANIVVPLAFINGMERSDFLFALNITGAAISFVLGFIFVSTFGIMGAAFARAVVQIYVVIVSLWFLRSRLSCKLPLLHLGLLGVSALASAASALLVSTQLQGLVGLLLSVAIAVIVYLLLVRWTKAIPDEDIESLEILFAHGPPALQRVASLALNAILGSRRRR